MKDGKTQSQIAQLLNRHKSTISRDLARNTGNWGYRPRQPCLLAKERSLDSRNAAHINPKDWDIAVTYLYHKWSPEQIADQVGISHETIYRHVTPIKPLAAASISSCAAKRNARNAISVIGIAGAKSSAGSRSVSVQPTLRVEPKSVTGKAIP
jgi:IS30 family transposase